MPTRSSASSTKAFALARTHAAIGQRQLDVFENRQIADEIEALEDESDLAIADARAIREREVRDFGALERIAAARRRIEQAEDGEQRRFAATGRSGDRDVFARADIEMNAGERVGFHFVGQEHFRDAVEMDEGVGSVRAGAAGGLFVDGFG